MNVALLPNSTSSPHASVRKSKVARLPVSQLHQLKTRTLQETIHLEEMGQLRRHEEDIIEAALQMYLDIPMEQMQQLVAQASAKGISVGQLLAQLAASSKAAPKRSRA